MSSRKKCNNIIFNPEPVLYNNYYDKGYHHSNTNSSIFVNKKVQSEKQSLLL